MPLVYLSTSLHFTLSTRVSLLTLPRRPSITKMLPVVHFDQPHLTCAANASILAVISHRVHTTYKHTSTHTHTRTHTWYNIAYDKWKLNYLLDLHVQKKAADNEPAAKQANIVKAGAGRRVEREHCGCGERETRVAL